MTLAMMRQFGIEVEREGRKCIVSGNASFGVPVYEIEPDVSGACYFYAMAPLLKTSVIVNGVHENSIQGDLCAWPSVKCVSGADSFYEGFF